MIENNYKSYDEKGFNYESHNKKMLIDLYNECERIGKSYLAVAGIRSEAICGYSADDCGTKLLQAFYKMMPIIGEITRQIEKEMDIK